MFIYVGNHLSLFWNCLFNKIIAYFIWKSRRVSKLKENRLGHGSFVAKQRQWTNRGLSSHGSFKLRERAGRAVAAAVLLISCIAILHIGSKLRLLHKHAILPRITDDACHYVLTHAAHVSRSCMVGCNKKTKAKLPLHFTIFFHLLLNFQHRKITLEICT